MPRGSPEREPLAKLLPSVAICMAVLPPGSLAHWDFAASGPACWFHLKWNWNVREEMRLQRQRPPHPQMPPDYWPHSFPIHELCCRVKLFRNCPPSGGRVQGP